ncbi:mitochondrial K+-H+ exchange-related-domain-containing protein [Mrakia frigida]|uniref:Mrx19p n=1 Tax=Mrakia frigida TaxID=29902 RepID=UPI003FCC0615
MSASKMKILALPLARIGPPGTKPLIYFHTFTPPISAQPVNHDAAPKSRFRLLVEERAGLVPNAPWPLQLTTRATTFWNELGHAPEKSWKFKAHKFGEREMDRIEFEEWSLKGLERGLVPKGLLRAPQVENTVEDKEVSSSQGGKPKEIVSLLYPKVEPPIEPLPSLSAFLSDRKPYHDRKMKIFFWCSPLTIPFGLLPIVPNFAFFFVAWRAWSHWKARNAAEILEQLIASGRIQERNSTVLDKAYASTKPRAIGQGEIYLTEVMVKMIVKGEGLGESGHDELMRAVGQAQLRLEKAKKDDPSTVAEHVAEKAKELDPKTSPTEEAKKGKTK